jgi:hypothetical protein
MFQAIGVSAEVIRRALIGIIRFAGSRDKRNVLHHVKKLIVHRRIPMLVRGIGAQILFIPGISDGLKNARFLGYLYIGAIPVIAGQIVVHDVANFMERGGLKQDFGLILQKIRGHIDNESRVPHFLVANDLGKHVANGGGIVSCFYGMIDDPQTNLVARTQPGHRLIDLTSVQRHLLIKAAQSNTVLGDLKSRVTCRQLGMSVIGCKQ